jgi:hypothetical protein
MPFSTKWMMNGYAMMMRFGRARLDYRFEMAITFDPTVGTRSNGYRSFRMFFGMERMSNRYSVTMRSGRTRLE